ncbi:MAG: universal stress protein [Bacteroidota bacterium]
MKNLLVPTDFSVPADNALQLAIRLANQWEATVHLLHSYEIQNQTGNFLSIQNFMASEARAELTQTIERIKSSRHYGTTIKARAMEGPTIDNICETAQSVQADLIIMGTQGANNWKKRFFGSNTSGMIKKSQVPVLAVPNGYQYQAFEKITLAVDTHTVSSAQVVQPLITLAQLYNSQVELVHVSDGQSFSWIDAGLDIYLSDIPHRFHQITNTNIHQGLRNFIEINQSDLLCTIHRHRSFLDNLFHVSTTRKEAFNLSVPLLSLVDE